MPWVVKLLHVVLCIHRQCAKDKVTFAAWRWTRVKDLCLIWSKTREMFVFELFCCSLSNELGIIASFEGLSSLRCTHTIYYVHLQMMISFDLCQHISGLLRAWHYHNNAVIAIFQARLYTVAAPVNLNISSLLRSDKVDFICQGERNEFSI